MEFKIISLEDLRECLSNFLMHFYNGQFSDLKKNVFLDIDEKMFEEFRIRPVTKEEIIRLVELNKKNVKKDSIRIKNAWGEKEKEILYKIKIRTGLEISTENIVCSLNPYTSNGFYGENNITLGLVDENSETDVMVIAHELFHIFYWRKLRELGLFSKRLGKEKQWEWALAEVTVYLLQKDLQKSWPNTKIELYPETKEVYDRVKYFWKKEKFDNYLIKSYELFSNGESI